MHIVVLAQNSIKQQQHIMATNFQTAEHIGRNNKVKPTGEKFTIGWLMNNEPQEAIAERFTIHWLMRLDQSPTKTLTLQFEPSQGYSSAQVVTFNAERDQS